MRTWLQPVQYASGPAGKPRAVHLRRIGYERTSEGLRVREVAKAALCGTSRLVAAAKQGTPPTCRRCIRIAAMNTETKEETREH